MRRGASWRQSSKGDGSGDIGVQHRVYDGTACGFDPRCRHRHITAAYRYGADGSLLSFDSTASTASTYWSHGTSDGVVTSWLHIASDGMAEVAHLRREARTLCLRSSCSGAIAAGTGHATAVASPADRSSSRRPERATQREFPPPARYQIVQQLAAGTASTATAPSLPTSTRRWWLFSLLFTHAPA